VVFSCFQLQIKQAAVRYLNLSRYRLLLFGSRAAGRHPARSDYVIGVFGPKKITLQNKFALLDDLERLPTLKKN
jgi:hypothetical protein